VARSDEGGAARGVGHGTLVDVTDEQQNDDTAPLAHLETLVDAWVTVPEASEIQGLSLSAVRGQIKDREYVAVRRGPNNAVYIPAVFVTPEGPMTHLTGTITVLADGGMNDIELLTWLRAGRNAHRGAGRRPQDRGPPPRHGDRFLRRTWWVPPNVEACALPVAAERVGRG